MSSDNAAPESILSLRAEVQRLTEERGAEISVQQALKARNSQLSCELSALRAELSETRERSNKPATEQPRIWRCMDKDFGASKSVAEEIRARNAAHLYGCRVQYSTDNGKTWVDEQAMEATEVATQEPGESAGSLSDQEKR